MIASLFVTVTFNAGNQRDGSFADCPQRSIDDNGNCIENHETHDNPQKARGEDNGFLLTAAKAHNRVGQQRNQRTENQRADEGDAKDRMEVCVGFPSVLFSDGLRNKNGSRCPQRKKDLQKYQLRLRSHGNSRYSRGAQR